MPEFFNQLFSSVWSVVLIVLFLGGSVFVHELGHFWAARRRGLHVDRFSIGFGPKIFSWVRDGVEYRISWIPFGGYVALPQLADMSGIEGASSPEVKSLPPISYTSKMIVSVMGAVFNVIFAFLIACFVWIFGLPKAESQNTTVIGFVSDTLTLPDGSTVPSPASKAGIREGDEITAINGKSVNDWDSLRQTLASSGGRDNAGNPRITITVLRDGESIDLEVFPQLAGREHFRTIGVSPAEQVIIRATAENSPARLAGLKFGDRIVSAGGEPMDSIPDFNDMVDKHVGMDLPVTVERGNESITTTVRPVEVAYTTDGKTMSSIGISEYIQNATLSHPTPLKQVKETVTIIQRTFSGLLNPQSDLTIGHLSGPPGIIRVIWVTSQIDIRYVLWFVVVINLNFAIFNLLPIPVLDGGHMLFATIGKLRGRALPVNFIATIQGAFMVLLFSLMVFVSIKDGTRWYQYERDETDLRETYVQPVFKRSIGD